MSLFFFNDTATTEIYTLSLHDALPISLGVGHDRAQREGNVEKRIQRLEDATVHHCHAPLKLHRTPGTTYRRRRRAEARSEEHTSELQSRQYLACRLLLEKKNQYTQL